MLASDVGARLRRARQERGMTLADLAGDDLTPRMLSAIERGKQRVPLDLLVHLAERVGSPIEEFVAGTEEARLAVADVQLARVENAIRESRPHDALDLLAVTRVPPQLKARALFLEGWGRIETGEPDGALPFLAPAETLATESGDLRQAMRTQYAVYLAHCARGRYDEAQEACRRAHATALQVGDDLYLGRVTTALGHMAYMHEDFASAAQLYRRARDLLSSVSDLEILAAVYTGLSRVSERQGDIPSALKYARLGLTVYRSKQNKRDAAHESNQIAARYRQIGDLEAALEAAQQALAWAQEAGAREVETLTRSTLAAIELDRGNVDAAKREAQIAVEMATLDTDQGRIDALMVLGSIAEREGQHGVVDAIYTGILAVLAQGGYYTRYADAALAYSLALRTRGDEDGAFRLALQSARADRRR